MSRVLVLVLTIVTMVTVLYCGVSPHQLKHAMGFYFLVGYQNWSERECTLASINSIFRSFVWEIGFTFCHDTDFLKISIFVSWFV